MKTIGVEEFRAHLDQYLAEAAERDVVLTQGGKRWVLLRSVADLDRDSADLAKSPEFWQMIRQRRQEQGIPWEEAQRLLDLD